MLSLESFTTCATEVGAATTSQVWVSEYQAAYRTFCLENFCRWFDKLAVISSKRLLLWPAVRLCPSLSSSHSPSLSSQWCVGGWSFLLLSKFCLLCVYIQSQVNKLHHNSYQIIAVMTVCVNYYSNTMYYIGSPSFCDRLLIMTSHWSGTSANILRLAVRLHPNQQQPIQFVGHLLPNLYL